MKNDILAERLGLFMETSGLSQKELSRLTGVSDSVICRVIKGGNDLSTKNLIKIATATNISPNWLLGFGSDDEIEYLEK